MIYLIGSRNELEEDNSNFFILLYDLQIKLSYCITNVIEDVS